jgi:hypothetical protein
MKTYPCMESVADGDKIFREFLESIIKQRQKESKQETKITFLSTPRGDK